MSATVPEAAVSSQPTLMQNLWEYGSLAGVAVISNWQAKCQLAQLSEPLSICTTTSLSHEEDAPGPNDTLEASDSCHPFKDGKALAIFHSMPGVTDTNGFDGKGGSAKLCTAQLLADQVGFTGGCIYCAEWCPQRTAEAPPGHTAAADSKEQQDPHPKRARTELNWRYLAVSVCSDSHRTHSRRKPVNGTGMIQIWRLKNSVESTGAAPEMTLGMLHEGSLNWGISWCPCEPHQLTSGGRSLLGLMACAHSNGAVAIYPVPSPDSVAAERHPVVQSEAIARFDLWEELACLPSCLHWLPAKPHDLLLVGTWCGQVLLFKIRYDAEDRCRLELMRRFSDQQGAIRSVSFPPPHTTMASEDGSLRHYATVAGEEGYMNVYDLRDASEPTFALDRRARTVTTAVKWIEAMEWLLTADDGTLCLDSTRGKSKGQLRSMTLCVDLAPFTTCDVTPNQIGFEWCGAAGEQGDAIIVVVDPNNKRRKTNPGPQVCSQLRHSVQGYRMYSPYRAAPKPEKGTLESRFPDKKLAITSVRFASLGDRGNKFCYAICHAAGFLRFQTLSTPEVPDVATWPTASWYTGDEFPFPH